MKNKKIYYFVLPAIALIMAGSIGIKSVKALETANSKSSPLIEALVKKFNLNQEEVDKTVQQVRQERQEQRQSQWEDGLNQAVSDGVITEAQKQALLNKHAEKQAQTTKNRQEMKKWMEENNLDWEKLKEYGIGGFGFGGRRGGFCK